MPPTGACLNAARSIVGIEGKRGVAVIAVINRKGGSGKSTLATHLASYCARTGASVLLGDVDRQQSTQTWLRLRKAQAVSTTRPIVGWAIDPSAFARPPAGIDHVIFDTPGGLRGFDLARIVMYADAILMPVCNSIFDRESAADCLAELRTLPRIANGRCRVGAVGMRLDPRTRAADVVQAWAAQLRLPFVTTLRESQAYVRCIEQGLSLFDLPEQPVQADLAQWQPILQWLQPVLQPATDTATERSIDRPVDRPADRRPHQPELRVAQAARPASSPLHAEPALARDTVRATKPATLQRPVPAPALRPASTPAASPVSRFLGALPSLAIPRFLQRTP